MFTRIISSLCFSLKKRVSKNSYERMAIRITLECGHSSMLRMRTTPQGYTHDWELFVRGIDNADIHHYVEKGKYTFKEIPCIHRYKSSDLFWFVFQWFFNYIKHSQNQRGS